MEVVGDVRDLLVEPVGRVRHDSPRRPPARSTANRWLAVRAGHRGPGVALGVDPAVEVLQERDVGGEHVLDDPGVHVGERCRAG